MPSFLHLPSHTLASNGPDPRPAAIGWGVALLVFMGILYALTLQPMINGSSDKYAEDVGEFQNVLTQWGTAHPTGYPLYSLTGAAATSVLRLFGVAPAASASAYSTLVMLLTLIGVYLLLLRLAIHPPWAAGTAALLGLLFPFWYHASVAEVYALLIGLLVLLLLIAVQWRTDRQPRHLYELAFVFGLAFGHHRLAALIAPALLVLVWPVLWSTLRERPLRLLGALLSLAAAFLIYLYLPLRAWLGSSWIYGQPGTWQGFWAIVLAREYGALVKPAANLGQTEAGVFQVITTLADSVTWPLLVAGAFGLGVSFAQQARRGVAVALMLLAITTVAFAGVFSRAVFLEAALMPAMLALILGVGLCAQWLADRSRIGSVVAAGALLIALSTLAYSNGPGIYAMTHDRGGQAIIDNVRAAGIDRAADRPVVMALWGRDHFALAYARYVTGELAGIDLVDHRADVKQLIAARQALYVLRPTFYLLPLEWWNSRLGRASGRAYLSSFAGDLVRVSDQPVLTETDVPVNRAIPMAPGVALRDWHVTPLADGRWQIVLYWQAEARPDRAYSISVKATDQAAITSAQDIVAQVDSSAPVYGWYPMSLWSPGEIVRDDYVIAPSPDRPARQVEVSLYLQDSAGNFQNFGRQMIPLQ